MGARDIEGAGARPEETVRRQGRSSVPSGSGRVRSPGWRQHRLRIGILVLLLTLAVVVLLTQRMSQPADTDVVVTATVRQLWLSPEAYLGKRVATNGIVRIFLAGTANEHFAVEQAGQHRVGLQGVERARLLSLLDAEVAVEGVLRFEEGSGIYIQVERLTLAGGHPVEGSAVPIDPRP